MSLSFTTLIVFVHDMDKMKAFYSAALGLEILEEIPAQWTLLQAGAGQIGLHQLAQQQPYTPGSIYHNNTKIIFETDTLDLLREQLLQRGTDMGAVTTFEGFDFRLCDGRDPEGNVFQLQQKQKA